jgi:cell division protein ZapE
VHLVERAPKVSPEELVSGLVPPPRFAHVRFDTYVPAPGEPTQAGALVALRVFAEDVDAGARATGKRKLFRGKQAAARGGAAGIYLDGGFGVGKTHLLASLWHAVEGPKAYGTFVEFTSLVGALGFEGTVARLSSLRLLCIDEFELDDPGDTMLVSTLLSRLVDVGVRLAATSNTQPEDLGAGRFAAEDFLREIQGLAAHFRIVTVDGPDFRQRGLPPAPAPFDDGEVSARGSLDGASEDEFTALSAHLAELHPSRYGALVAGVSTVCLHGVTPVPNQATALRLVVLIDRLYDGDVALVASGVPANEVFPADLLVGSHRKKYLRCISRWSALARQGVVLP